MMTLLGINKILAIYVGPAGYAALGNFQNAVQMITAVAGGSINNGVIKYTAEYKDDEVEQRKVWRTAGTIALLASSITAIAIALLNKPLAVWFLKDENYGGVFVWFAVSIVFFAFNALLLAILNGKKDVARYVAANIFGSIANLIVTLVMAICFGLYGALVAMAAYQSFAFFVTIKLCRNASWFNFRFLLGAFDRRVAINLIKYMAMALTSAVCVPVSHVLVRDYLGLNFGWQAAGYWEAMWRLSAAYLMLVTATLSVYYLPRISELRDSREISMEMTSGFKLILPVLVVVGLAVYFLRDFLVSMLFTSDFYPVRELFAWQMVGDLFKVSGWMLAYLMLGKAMYKSFIATEVFFSLSFYFFVRLLCERYGVQGVVMAHALNYVIYLIVMLGVGRAFLRGGEV